VGIGIFLDHVPIDALETVWDGTGDQSEIGVQAAVVAQQAARTANRRSFTMPQVEFISPPLAIRVVFFSAYGVVTRNQLIG
jgi:hypothetical protein